MAWGPCCVTLGKAMPVSELQLPPGAWRRSLRIAPWSALTTMGAAEASGPVCVPGSVGRRSCLLTCFLLSAALRERFYYWPHFPDKETEHLKVARPK